MRNVEAPRELAAKLFDSAKQKDGAAAENDYNKAIQQVNTSIFGILLAAKHDEKYLLSSLYKKAAETVMHANYATSNRDLLMEAYFSRARVMTTNAINQPEEALEEAPLTLRHGGTPVGTRPGSRRPSRRRKPPRVPPTERCLTK